MTSTTRKQPLRTGYTTGSCASAAAKGAALTLLGAHPKEVTIELPIGTTATIPLQKSWIKNGAVYCTVIKDAGDDPDITHGAEIGVQLFLTPSKKRGSSGRLPIILKGGEGIGMVTKPGLPVKKGEAAINPVPRKMIRNSVVNALLRDPKLSAPLGRVEVVLFVPRGEELAKKTFNPRLGIIGGISILGTTGIVKPFSHQAYRETICCALQIARAAECNEIVLSTGGLSERLAKSYFPQLREESFIQMGDYAGFALNKALQNKFRYITISVFMGKLSKIAAGCDYTHARCFPLDVKFIVSLGKTAGVKPKVLREISQALTIRRVLEIILKHRAYTIIDTLCAQAIGKLYQMSNSRGAIFLVLFSFDNEVLWYGGKKGKITGIN